MKKLNFKLTQHCRERYCERINNIRKTKIEKFLSHAINVRALDAKIYADLETAVITDKPLQIANIKEHVVKKYGNDLKFYHSNKVIYVINCNTGENVITTCYDKKGYIGYFI